jgi:hypothetical protein
MGCHEQKPAATPPQSRLSEMPTANEVFNLRSKCEELAQKLEDESIIGPALSRSHISHYDPQTNRCYVEVDIHMADLDKFDEHNSRTVYDGQTREILVWIRNDHGKKAFYNKNGVPSFEAAEARINALIADDRKQ